MEAPKKLRKLKHHKINKTTRKLESNTDDGSQNSESLSIEETTTAMVKTRILLDDDSITKLPRKKPPRKARRKSRTLCDEGESTSSADGETLSTAKPEGPEKEPEEAATIRSKESFPCVPEDAFYYHRDRVKEARTKAAMKARLQCVRAKKELKRRAAIMPTARALAPPKQQKKEKGDVPYDLRSIRM